LHELVSYLLTGDAEGANIQIKKGGIVRLQFEGYSEPGSASLRWLFTPKVLRAVCSEPPRDPEG
jgi:phosphohistidine phosphatase SixA